MNVFKKFIEFFNRIFNKKEKCIDSKNNDVVKDTLKIDNSVKKEEFIDSIRVEKKKIKKENKIETLVCPGDGLGIQDKMDY